MMKAYNNILILLFFLGAIPLAQAQVGFGTETPDKAAVVEMESSKRGLLIPRLALQATDNKAPVTETTLPESLLVYNTATAGSGDTAVTPGYYYWKADKWHRLLMDTDLNLDDAGIEPWLNQDTNQKAKENTDNIYLEGNVAIGRTTAFNEDAVLDVAVTETDGTDTEIHDVFSVLNTGDIQAKLLPSQPFDEEKGRNVVVVDEDGNLRIMPGSLEFAIPRYFYMPSVIVPTQENQIEDINDMHLANTGEYYSYNSGDKKFTVDIYKMYKHQFTGEKTNRASSNSENKPNLFTFNVEDLIYNITWYDSRVFKNVQVSNQGVLTYEVEEEGPVSFGSFMNIVLEVK